MSKAEFLIEGLPDAESARRFINQFTEKYPAQAGKLLKNEGLLSDVLTIASFSPLLATTLLQNPNYLSWLGRKRTETGIRTKEELLESLARFSLTNSQIEPQILLARFRRRELLRIYLRDIRRLATIAEITEEISDLADAILEHALRIARQELENRYGTPMEIAENKKSKPAGLCIVSLGKLGSKELNYSSDIDLLFLYSAEGSTSGRGSRGIITNREYFVKLAESVIKLVGQQTGEGAAYRVDLRLRPHGSIGALAVSLQDTVRYYKTEARMWERQVLIRSRGSAGEVGLFKSFFSQVENSVFSKRETVENALQNVLDSKEKINLEIQSSKGYNVKLGKGGIREIEFIAQALQLAHGGSDKWLRSPHTLISLSRLADRKYLSEAELTELFEAYEFLRHLEHILQMENGLQIHTVPENAEKRLRAARRMTFKGLKEFENRLMFHSGNVNRVFTRIFGDFRKVIGIVGPRTGDGLNEHSRAFGNAQNLPLQIISSLKKYNIKIDLSEAKLKTLEILSKVSPHFAEILAANPKLINNLPDIDGVFVEKNYTEILLRAAGNEKGFARQIAILRKTWARLLLEIAVFDVFEKLLLKEVKRMQTGLAEASIETALFITKNEISKRFSITIDKFPFAILGLGKLGSGGIDYDSDLDLIVIYDDEAPLAADNWTHAEFYGRAVEIFVNVLSGMTRDGNLYRVDLRLRPYGKNGASAMPKSIFLEYMKSTAAIWELLAYVKIRGVAGDRILAGLVERETQRLIHERAGGTDISDLKNETRSIRLRLEKERSKNRPGKDIDIKFGSGGILDIYFAMRFLQLRDNVPDKGQNRSTAFMLDKLFQLGSLTPAGYNTLREGYEFLSALDHNLRLTVGRSTRLPLANQNALESISKRMNLASTDELHEKLTFHRLNIREIFENILSD